MNLHRRGITDHFNSCCKCKSYSIQLIDVLSNNDHDENGIEDGNIRRLRLGRTKNNRNVKEKVLKQLRNQ